MAYILSSVLRAKRVPHSKSDSVNVYIFLKYIIIKQKEYFNCIAPKLLNSTSSAVTQFNLRRKWDMAIVPLFNFNFKINEEFYLLDNSKRFVKMSVINVIYLSFFLAFSTDSKKKKVCIVMPTGQT